MHFVSFFFDSTKSTDSSDPSINLSKRIGCF